MLLYRGGFQFYATVPNATEPSKLLVGPYFGDNNVSPIVSQLNAAPNGRSDNYWVVATDSTPNTPGFTSARLLHLTTA